jgi:hypothetical protein
LLPPSHDAANGPTLGNQIPEASRIKVKLGLQSDSLDKAPTGWLAA